MKNNFILISLVTILVIAGTFGYVQLSQEKNVPVMSDQAPVAVETESEISAASVGRYVEYSPAILETTPTNRQVFFFYANWCPTCKPADESFTNNENEIPNDVTVIRVNYNDNQTDQEEKELAKKYNVTYQHTYVQIDGNGNEVTKWNGGGVDQLLSNLK